eukprot:338901-Pelagomonas_calceolata.AAC.1
MMRRDKHSSGSRNSHICDSGGWCLREGQAVPLRGPLIAEVLHQISCNSHTCANGKGCLRERWAVPSFGPVTAERARSFSNCTTATSVPVADGARGKVGLCLCTDL